MPKLSDTQAVLLAAAAAREDLSLHPISDTIKLRGAAPDRTIKALIRRGFIAERAISGRARRSKSPGISFVITPVGLAAIGVETPQAAPDPARGASTPEAGSAATQVPEHPGGKLGLLLDAVGGPNGATLDELTTSTGWLPHTTRSALTRLRQRGFDVRVATTGGRKAYRLATAV